MDAINKFHGIRESVLPDVQSTNAESPEGAAQISSLGIANTSDSFGIILQNNALTMQQNSANLFEPTAQIETIDASSIFTEPMDFNAAGASAKQNLAPLDPPAISSPPLATDHPLDPKGVASQEMATDHPHDPKGIASQEMATDHPKDPEALIKQRRVGDYAPDPDLGKTKVGNKKEIEMETKMHELTIQGDMKALANDPGSFHSEIRSIFGQNYSSDAAEKLRVHIMNDDFKWMPNIDFGLGFHLVKYEGHRAAVGMDGTIYINPNSNGDSALQRKAIWASMRSQLDPQDAVNPEGRSFGTTSVDHQPLLVEWID